LFNELILFKTIQFVQDFVSPAPRRESKIMLERDPNFVYDVIVVGAGHAGCEAGLAAARMGKKTLVMATNLDTVGYLACNPSIGGTAKGNIVKEIDALGGEMGVNTDKTLIQLRMLNRGKGPAVHCPRAQVDKYKYHFEMKRTMEHTPNLFLRQAEGAWVLHDDQKVYGIRSAQGLTYYADAIILATGVYLNSRIIVGEWINEVGPNGFANAKCLTESLVEMGFEVRRFKTGTPARVHARSIDFDKMIPQPGEPDMPPFSYLNDTLENNQYDCYLTYTAPETHEVIRANIDKAPLFSGSIKGTGPRYCPSIEDKVTRFADKDRHQIFLEREGLDTDEIYVQGMSSSMPAEIQYKIYKTLPGLENVEIMRDAYAIEYDCIDPTQLYPTLMYKNLKGLFCAGQINGTSGYEEAAGQGLVAGINAVRYLDNKEMLVLDRATSYIGVLIDDLTTKGTNEPYRMMTSRAEYRLLLRQDNADTRLTQIGRDMGLVNDERYEIFLKKQAEMQKIFAVLETKRKPKEFRDLFEAKGEVVTNGALSYREMLRRHNISIFDLQKEFDILQDMSKQALEQAEIDVKYEGYIQKEKEQVEQFNKMEQRRLPDDLNYDEISGLRIEARQKLNKIRPQNLGQASRISGVSPADVTVLIVWLAQNKKEN